MEESSRYMRGLLQNYVEIDKMGGDLRADMMLSAEKTLAQLKTSLLFSAIVFVVSCLAMMYDMFIASTIAAAGIAILATLIGTIAMPLLNLHELIETKDAECVEIKKSNHIFPDLVPSS